MFNTNTKLENTHIGNNNLFDYNCLFKNSIVNNYCNFSINSNPPPNSTFSDYTVVYGPNNNIRKQASQAYLNTHMIHIDYLKANLPSKHK